MDHFTKMAPFIALKTQLPFQYLARTFLQEIWHLHKLPEEIISDRDSRFEGRFWNPLMKLLNVDVRMSTAYHSQSDGHTERVNQTLEQHLRNYCSYKQDDWFDLLSTGTIQPLQSHPKCHRSRSTMAISPKCLGLPQNACGKT